MKIGATSFAASSAARFILRITSLTRLSPPGIFEIFSTIIFASSGSSILIISSPKYPFSAASRLDELCAPVFNASFC